MQSHCSESLGTAGLPENSFHASSCKETVAEYEWKYLRPTNVDSPGIKYMYQDYRDRAMRLIPPRGINFTARKKVEEAVARTDIEYTLNYNLPISLLLETLCVPSLVP